MQSTIIANPVTVENVFGESVEVADNPLLQFITKKGGKITGTANFDRDAAAGKCLESLKKLPAE